MGKGIANHSIKIFSLFENIPLYNSATMKSIRSIRAFNESATAEKRLQIIQFHSQYGTQATKDAFMVSKPTIYRWRRKLKDNKGRLECLIPVSRSPKRKRVMNTNFKIIEFIKSLREQYGHLGKEKIKPLLDEYCLKVGLSSLSESTIGKVIKRNNLYVKVARIHHDPASKRGKTKPNYKLKVKRSPKIDHTGYIEVDTVVRFKDGLKLYIFNAVDIKLKFQFSYGYTSLSSFKALDFFKKLELVYPIQQGIKVVQTDNGLEFLGAFDNYLQTKHIPHLFIYPRCPKINSFVERANRTLQEEFVDGNIDLIHDGLSVFNSRLIDYLLWYNTKRVHKALGNVTPINYLLQVLPQESQMYVTYTCT